MVLFSINTGEVEPQNQNEHEMVLVSASLYIGDLEEHQLCGFRSIRQAHILFVGRALKDDFVDACIGVTCVRMKGKSAYLQDLFGIRYFLRINSDQCQCQFYLVFYMLFFILLRILCNIYLDRICLKYWGVIRCICLVSFFFNLKREREWRNFDV